MSTARLDRQQALLAESLAADQRELELLRTRSGQTLGMVATIKRTFPGAKVVSVREKTGATLSDPVTIHQQREVRFAEGSTELMAAKKKHRPGWQDAFWMARTAEREDKS